MKSLKIILLITFISFSCNLIYAQGVGIRAGVNFQNINGKDNTGNQLKNNLITGFHAGLNYEIPVGTDIYFQPGLMFTTKGSEIDVSDEKFGLSYIELPLNIVFKPLLGTGRMLLGFGPYVAYGIGGKVKPSQGDNMELDFKSELSAQEILDPDTRFIKAFDAGANIIIGYELASKISLQLNAQLGLINISPDLPGENDPVWKNTGYGLSVGYRF